MFTRDDITLGWAALLGIGGIGLLLGSVVQLFEGRWELAAVMAPLGVLLFWGGVKVMSTLTDRW